MNKRVLIATLTGGVFSFFAGWFLFGIVMGAYYTRNTVHYEGLMKPEPMIWAYIITNLAIAWFFAYILDTWAKAYTFMKGLIPGIIVSIPLTLNYDVFVYGTMNLINEKIILSDLIISAIVMGLTAGVVAQTLGMVKGDSEK